MMHDTVICGVALLLGLIIGTVAGDWMGGRDAREAERRNRHKHLHQRN